MISPQKTGIATFTLDYGRCPAWLFEKMRRLAAVIATAIIEEFGTEEFLRRLADPVWFQSFGTVLAFDWNASGLTTTTMAALKEGLKEVEKDYGIFICGGKGKTSKKTPEQINYWANLFFDHSTGKTLTQLSYLIAKIDSSLIQDGFQIYHHNFVFDRQLNFAVIQQGMNTHLAKARRYHWFGNSKLMFEREKRLIENPHSGIVSQIKLSKVLNLTAKESRLNRKISLDLISSPKTLFGNLKILKEKSTNRPLFKSLTLEDAEFHTHPILKEEFSLENPYLQKNFQKLAIIKPKTFKELLLVKGVGGKTIRSLSLVAEIIYGVRPSYEDPARYSFAHGGKDGTPYPVDRKVYERTLSILEKALLKSRLYFKEKDQALRRAYQVFGIT